VVIKRKGWDEGARQLSQAQRDALARNTDWSAAQDTDAPQLPVKRSTFVPPAPSAPIRITRIEPPEEQELAPAPVAQVQQLVKTSETDRAKGFTIATVPLAATTGIVAGILAATLGGVPVVSGALLATVFTVFAATWGLAYAWNQSTSPGGLGLWTIWLHYRLLRFEQKARIERMRGGDRGR
jgi:hypothetical protein